jgi:hypothetical protein
VNALVVGSSGPLQPCKPVHECHITQHAPRAMPPRKRRQRADGGPGVSGDDGAGPGPSPRVAGLLDVLDAVLAHGRLERGTMRALQRMCSGARLAVDGSIKKLDLLRGNVLRGDLQQDRAALRRFLARLPGLLELEATWDAALLSQVAVARSGMPTSTSLRRMALHLPDQCTHLDAEFGVVLAAFSGLEVRIATVQVR